MKARNGYVSNSSSSSFIIAGNGVMDVFNQHLNDGKILKTKYYDDEFTIGDITKEMISQCKESNETHVKGIISGLIYQSASSYKEKIFHNITKKRSVCYDWDDVPEDKWYEKYHKGTLFDINNKIKKMISNGVKDIFDKTKSTECWDYYKVIDSEEYENLSNELVDEIYNKMVSENKEIYAVSFGDNHGACSGAMGWFVEDQYLGEKAMNNYLKTNFKIYHLNCH